MRKGLLFTLLAGALCLSLTISALGAGPPSDLEAAAAYVREQGIMVGDQNGNMNLASSLNRAELAVLLTRLNGGMEKVQLSLSKFAQSCTFSDVPAWAKPYVSYCAENQLMAGYGDGIFGPNDLVTPAMACTVILRACGIEDGGGSIWSYNTACAYAVSLGWLDEDSTHSAAITRGG